MLVDDGGTSNSDESLGLWSVILLTSCWRRAADCCSFQWRNKIHHQWFQTVDVERTSQHSWTEGKSMFHVFYQRCRTWTPSARSDVEDSSAVYQQGNPWVWTLLFLFLLSDMFTGTVSNYLDETRSERWSAWVSQESRPGPCSSVPSERTCCVLMTSLMSRRRLQPCFSFVDSTAVKPLITNIWHSAWNQYILVWLTFGISRLCYELIFQCCNMRVKEQLWLLTTSLCETAERGSNTHITIRSSEHWAPGVSLSRRCIHRICFGVLQ